VKVQNLKHFSTIPHDQKRQDKNWAEHSPSHQVENDSEKVFGGVDDVFVSQEKHKWSQNRFQDDKASHQENVLEPEVGQGELFA
jgi:hypothetical protein